MKKLLVFTGLLVACSVKAQLSPESYLLQFDSIRELPDSREKSEMLNNLAWEGKYVDLELTEKIAEASLMIAAKNNYLPEAGFAYKLKGIVCDETGRYTEAVEWYLEAISAYRQIPDSMGMAKCEANIGMIYLHTKKQREALAYFFRPLETFRANRFAVGEQLCFLNIGICYLDLDMDDSARYYFEAAKKIMEENQYIDPSVYGNLGLVYSKTGDQELARSYLEKCIGIYEQRSPGDQSLKVWYQNIGAVYMDLGLYDKAVVVLQRALEITGENIYTREMTYLLKTLVRASKAKADYRQTVIYLEQLVEVSDSIYSVENLAQLNDVKEKYESEKKQLQIDALNKEKKVEEIKRQQEETKVTYFRWGSAGLGVLLFFVVGGLVVKTKDNRKIKEQNGQIESQRVALQEKNGEIMASIEYARRIQTAILPPDKLVRSYLRDSFVLYKPKDIVAGDFYWMESVQENSVLFAVADCTGHGVPGAMVSVVCHNALNRSVREFGLTDPGKILDKVTELVVEQFSKSEENVKDGMDVALCCLNGRELYFAGANNPLWIVRNGEIIELNGNKQPVGKFERLEPFTTHRAELQAGDTLYLFSDGYADQFGGEAGKKFKTKTLRSLLKEINRLDMSAQRLRVDEVFENWRGSIEQIDDVCIIGVRIS